MRRLPATVDDLRGLRAARWIRESTTGQFDRYGPEAQAELQDGAVARLGLVDTGAQWRIAHSGRTVYRSPAMAAMLPAYRVGRSVVGSDEGLARLRVAVAARVPDQSASAR